MQPNEKPRLEMTSCVKGEPMSYRCSRCGQIFLPPEDRSFKDATAELLEAFHDHVGEAHAEEAND